MKERMLILPTEVKVCATCTYWDGIRTLDPEVKVVVVEESCHGECLVSQSAMPGLTAVHEDCDCLWEDLHPDDPAAVEGPSAAPPPADSGEKP